MEGTTYSSLHTWTQPNRKEEKKKQCVFSNDTNEEGTIYEGRFFPFWSFAQVWKAQPIVVSSYEHRRIKKEAETQDVPSV